ncbi:Glutamyl-Q tRNA(Asp) synthetase [Edwardsiella ictaluri]|nr:Glutamyl-Q tRNA(Asp) synthetase [Edwardsiella ictaluri]
MSYALPTPPEYIGRFAPSPSGDLHFGSLIAALGSYLRARACGGRWLVRIEDIDPPREVPGAAARILRALEHYGLHWDGPVLYQSQRHEAYHAILEQLHRQGLAYYCTCTRQRIHALGGCMTGIAAIWHKGRSVRRYACARLARYTAFTIACTAGSTPMRRWRARILSYTVKMACLPIIWRWWLTTIFRASMKSSAALI